MQDGACSQVHTQGQANRFCRDKTPARSPFVLGYELMNSSDEYSAKYSNISHTTILYV